MELQHRVEVAALIGKVGPECVGLLDGAWEAVQYEPGARVRLRSRWCTISLVTSVDCGRALFALAGLVE